MTDRVLVTGVSGFVGSHVALALLNAGYTVRGSVRSLGRAERIREVLKAAGADISRLEIVALDLLADDGWTEALDGCRYLQHVASPFTIQQPKDPAELIRPAVEGTRRAVQAALDADVDRIVLTSSAAAVMYGHPRERTEPFTAADWSHTEGPDVTAYTESKTRAELEAWSLVEAAGRRHDMVAINPTVILGPLLDDDPGTSAGIIVRLLDGSAPAAPRIHFGIVDIRDIAALHVTAMTAPEAAGQRVLASAGTISFFETANFLREPFPDYAHRLPRMVVPDWVIRLYGLFDASAAAAAGSLGLVRHLDSRPAEALLGRAFISPRIAATATARSVIERGLVPAARRRERD